MLKVAPLERATIEDILEDPWMQLRLRWIHVRLFQLDLYLDCYYTFYTVLSCLVSTVTVGLQNREMVQFLI
ncbi:hypothetical protein DAPPUDRAFT_252323 [Daphnia pulex]|uniref:Uncharacterized protein n=1 Tax=Daphnia pulex TaxID=6669 RepID=E9H2G7_DAPPU|nr:hypothetical protein DAPPUDRAFT_252323 [Daphnia pulex]|eukprot:EFX73976.1 hypothetical protein DAPPUDRAFT_252323 [Daphnia pulex]